MKVTINEIITRLKECNIVPEISEDTQLFDEGLIDSFSIFNDILPMLIEKYDIEVDPLDLMPDNFETPTAIANYINRMKGNK